MIKAGGGFAIEVAGFRTLTDKDRMFSTYYPPTTSSSAPATTQAALGSPLLTMPEGSYYDGRQTLTLVTPDHKIISWPLPPTATGTLEKPWLIETPDHHLFLYNQPGRILRIRPNSSSPATGNWQLATPPFVLEATFAHKIPNANQPTRIWLDPAGRIIIANNSTLSILFPNGRIPRPTINIIPTDQLDELEQ